MKANKYYIIGWLVGFTMVGFGLGIALKGFLVPQPQQGIEVCDQRCEEVGMAMVGVNISYSRYITECSCGFEDPE